MATTRTISRPTRQLIEGLRPRSYATVAAPPPSQALSSTVQRHPPTQPPSYKDPTFRKSQLLRQYVSLLQSTPLMLLFQHNNLRASEWAGIRRELTAALQRAGVESDAQSGKLKLQIIQTGLFAAALRLTEAKMPSPIATGEPLHFLSSAAHQAARRSPLSAQASLLDNLLAGPLAVLSFPGVTPAQLAATLRVLAPTPGSSSAFAAPRRRDAPGLYEGPVQSGLAKLMLLGARVEGRVMDGEGTRWVGGITGGLDGLRGQLVNLLTSVGMGITGALDGQSRSLYVTMEGRRMQMEEDSKSVAGEEKPAEATT